MNVQFGARFQEGDLRLPPSLPPAAKQLFLSQLLGGPLLGHLRESTPDDIFVRVENSVATPGAAQVVVGVDRPDEKLSPKLSELSKTPLLDIMGSQWVNPNFLETSRNRIAERLADVAMKLKEFDGQTAEAEAQALQNSIPTVDFSDVAGMDELKGKAQDDIITPFKHRELAKQVGVGLPNATLLMGPPGTGKTYFAERLAGELGVPFETFSLKDVGSKYKDETVLKVHEKFDELEAKAPCVVLMDEIDSLLKSRSKMGDDTVGKSDDVNAVLERLNNIGQKGVIVLMATNNPDALDAAGTRRGRVDNAWYVGSPDQKSREAAFKLHLKNRNTGRVNYKALAAKTEYYTQADLKAVVDKAARLALNAAIKSGTDTPKITMRHIEQALAEVPPSMNADKEAQYRTAAERLNATAASAGKAEASEPLPFGFGGVSKVLANA